VSFTHRERKINRRRPKRERGGGKGGRGALCFWEVYLFLSKEKGGKRKTNKKRGRPTPFPSEENASPRRKKKEGTGGHLKKGGEKGAF